MEALRAGAIDGGIVGETPPILEQAAGTKLKLIAAIQGDTSGSAIIVPKNSKITSVEELKGKKIAFAVGSAAETLLAQALAKNGLKLSDITPVDLQPGDALAAFGSGQVDAWVSWDPYTALAQASGAKTLITAPQAGNAGLSYLVVRADALSDPGKAAAFGDLIGRLAKAGVWRTTHEPEWVAKFVALTHLPAAIAKITIDRSQQHYVAIGAVVQKDQQAVADLLFDQGVVPKRLDESEVLDPRYNSVIASVLGTASAAK
jgi:sulfonate transport system substrate-binding protein